MSSEHDLDAIPSQLGDGVSDDPPQQDNPTPAEYVRTVLRSTRRAEGDPFMARVTQFGQPRLPSAADAAANPPDIEVPQPKYLITMSGICDES
mmetsp:Transcript_25778/g.67679  ORF Transcript_25778/g.67679 Transcript_25778/m.67679 type:complete len:93 (+) Transcript_25778:214-492(+)